MSPPGFLSKGIQLAILAFVVVIIAMSIQSSSMHKRIGQLEEIQAQSVTQEEFMEVFNSMFDAKMRGQSVSPYDDADSIRVDREEVSEEE